MTSSNLSPLAAPSKADDIQGDSNPDMGSRRDVFLIEKLARALHAYGAPAHRLEEAMIQLCERLGIQSQFFSTPTAIFAAVRHGDVERTVLLRVDPGDVNLDKLSLLDRVLVRTIRGELSASEAELETDQICVAAPRYGQLVTIFAFALASCTSAVFLGGGIREVCTAGILGLIIGATVQLLSKSPTSQRLVEIVTAALAAFLATLPTFYDIPVSSQLVTVAGLIILLPGLSLTVAIDELATRHLMSGAGRLAGAAVVFLTLGFGVAIGSRVGVAIFGEPADVAPLGKLPMWATALSLVLASISFLVLFQAHLRDLIWIILVGAVGLSGCQFGIRLLGPELGPFIGAFTVGVVSNFAARIRDRPAAVTQFPALLLLVPGSIGYRSLSNLLASDTLAGVQSAFSMALIAISLVAGLLFANVIFPPRRAL